MNHYEYTGTGREPLDPEWPDDVSVIGQYHPSYDLAEC